MKYKDEVDAVYKKFGEVLSLKRSKKYEDAIKLLSRMLPTLRNAALKREALSFRAIIYEEMGDLESSKKDALYALKFIKKETYAKYVIEIGMGAIYEKENNKKEALSWYSKALLTCAKSIDYTSGGTALQKFIRLKGEDKLTKKERALCEEIVRTSWKVHSLPGEPDLTNLHRIAEFLIKVECTPKSGG